MWCIISCCWQAGQFAVLDWYSETENLYIDEMLTYFSYSRNNKVITSSYLKANWYEYTPCIADQVTWHCHLKTHWGYDVELTNLKVLHLNLSILLEYVCLKNCLFSHWWWIKIFQIRNSVNNIQCLSDHDIFWNC